MFLRKIKPKYSQVSIFWKGTFPQSLEEDFLFWVFFTAAVYTFDQWEYLLVTLDQGSRTPGLWTGTLVCSLVGTELQEVSRGLASKVSSVFGTAPQHWHHHLGSTLDPQALDSHRNTGSQCQKGRRPLL